MTITKRQKNILKAINSGDFELCHLYDSFLLTYSCLRRHVRKLEAEGFVRVEGVGEKIQFGLTEKGRIEVSPIIIR